METHSGCTRPERHRADTHRAWAKWIEDGAQVSSCLIRWFLASMKSIERLRYSL
jgi:hypothetical protein